MNTKKLYSAIAAFNAVISDTPEAEDVNYTEDDTADYDAYDNAVDQIISGIDTAMNVLIKGAYFAIVEAPEHITPTVFATEEENAILYNPFGWN